MEFENLITLINAVSDSTLTGLKYEENGVKIQLTKKEGKVKVIAAPAAAPAALPVPASEAAAIQPAAAAAVQPEASADEAADKPGNIVKSPLVGTFYAAPAEDADPFVAVGDTVKKGQTLAIVEAMKLMNEIESDFDGKIAEVLVENGQPVEYGQPLFRIV
nr:acetyl-CoA carboxylase biotin carboxyl carrier protein [uncultured Merdimonas sp.]